MALSVPRGFVFKPTEQESITHFLIPKVMGFTLPCNIILDRNLYGENGAPWIVFSGNDPWQIVGDSEVRVTKKEIYVFTKLEYNGRRQMVRVAGCGTWAGKSKPQEIKNRRGEVIGVKRSFTFKVNGGLKKQEEITKTNGRWIMHEYTLAGSSLEGVDNTDYAICRISWDLPKCCIKEESWPPKMTDEEFSHCIEEMTWNQVLPYQELNSEAAASLQTEEIPSFIEEMTMNSEAAVSLQTEEIPSSNVEMLNSEAAVNEPTEEFYNLGEESSFDEEFLRALRS